MGGFVRPLAITFVHHPADTVATDFVDAAASLADGVGADRAGAFMRVPVRARSRPLGRDGSLRPILPEASALDVVVFLQSQWTETDGTAFDLLLAGLKAAFPEPRRLLYTSVTLDAGVAPPLGFEALQQIRWSDWRGLGPAERRVRALIRLFAAIRERLGTVSDARRSTIFVSHAKHDGRALAEAMVRHIRDPENALGLSTFYDALELRDGEDFAEGLEAGVRDGALLALASDAYEARPWCNQEILWAKRWRRAALIVDIGRKRVARTYPYLGNLPLRGHNLATSAGREAAILDLITEMLRVDLFAIASAQLPDGVVALPRPPELLDLAALVRAGVTRAVYPDPPLPDREMALLGEVAPGLRFETLDEALA